MYFNVVKVRVRLVADGRLGTDDVEVVDEVVEWVRGEQLDLVVDEALLNDVQRLVFESERPGAYMVEFRRKAIEQGASSSLGEFLIELIPAARDEAWRTLAVAVATYIAGRISGTDGDEP